MLPKFLVLSLDLKSLLLSFCLAELSLTEERFVEDLYALADKGNAEAQVAHSGH